MEQFKESETRLFSIKETCDRLGIGQWAVYRQISQHKLKSVKIGKRRLVSAEALSEFIKSMERHGT